MTSKFVGITMTPDEHQRMLKFCNNKDLSVSQLVRRATKKYMENFPEEF